MMIMPVSLQESVSDKKIIMKCILVSSLLFQDFAAILHVLLEAASITHGISCNQDWPQSREGR